MKLKIYTLLLVLSAWSLQSCDNDDDEHLPNLLTATMETFINEKYVGAKITEVDMNDQGFVEVDIIHDKISKEVLFEKNGDWISTSWDIHIDQLPEAVKNAVNSNPLFDGYRIDDADYYENASEAYYLIELEKNNLPDKKIKVTESGELLS